MNIPRVTALALALLAATSTAAAQKADPAPQLRREVELALLDLGSRNALGPADQVVRISQPAQVRYELGAVVDAPPEGGLRVLAVTPGGAAQRMNLAAGDRLLAVNGTRLGPGGDARRTLDRALQASDGHLRLEVARGDRTLALAGQADVTAVPAYQLTVGTDGSSSGCGYVSDRLGVVPMSQGIFSAQITRIDGRSTPLLFEPNRFRLPAGRHVLVVDERIPRSRIGLEEQRQIALMRQREKAGAYKALEVEIKPGVVHHVGARLVKEHMNSEGIRANRHWEPVVWQEKPMACR